MTELPSGTVTFLFTDIEGSTRLLKELRERYSEVRGEHDRIMRAAFAEAGGQEVDTQGDAFFVAFRRARDAVAAAVAAQRALVRYPWPDGAVVRVRMGIHTGEPTVGQDRYVGLGVHRAARICSAAHGGQVLLSNTTRDLVEDDLPSDVGLLDLGEHTLKDIDRPERLFQLTGEGLATDFPPPRSASGEATALVRGRERELAEAADEAVGAPRRWTRRNRPWTAVAAVIVLAVAALVAVVATRGGSEHATPVAANAVGLIDAGGNRVRDQVKVGAAPTSVAFGYASVWVASAYAGTVTRINPRTRSVVQRITVGNSPSGIAVGRGGVWVANHNDGTVSWINPQSNTEVKRIGVGNGPTAVAFGYGSVWVTNSDDRTVSRIDANTGDVVALIPTNAVGRGIAVGAGAVWVTDDSTNRVAEVDPGTNHVTARKAVGNGPAGIAYGAGDVWVANELDSNVSQIDPTTLSTRATIPVAGGPSALAFGDGGLWVSVEFGQRVVRINQRTGREEAVIPVGNRPQGLAAVSGGGGVWFAVQASGKGHRGGRLVVLGGGFDSIDPALASSTTSSSVLGLAYDGLSAFRRVGGSDGSQRVPDLASALPAPTDAGRSYTFRIRSGIRYSDGTPLRPQDFRHALERMFSLGSPNAAGTPLSKIVGAARCKKGRPCDLSRGVIVNGPSSLTFRLSAPDRTFLTSLVFVAPVPPTTPQKQVETKAIPSTGPYAIDSYAPGRQLTLVRNSHFHSWSLAARPDGYPDEIVWRILSGPKRRAARQGLAPGEAVHEVIDGKADVLFNEVPNNRVEELRAHYPGRLHLIPQRATVFLFLNTRRAPFDDVRVRRALNYAVDRQKVAALHGGSAQLTCQIAPPSVPGYRRFCPYTIQPDSSGDWKAPDLAKARALIAASGTKGERITVWTYSPLFGKESRYLVSLLQRLGYRAQLRDFADIGTYSNTLDRTPSVQAGILGWLGGLVAADTFSKLSCRLPANFAHFCDRRVDAQVKRLAAEQARDPTTGATLAERIERELDAKAPWVPLFTPRLADFVSSRVGNYQPNTYDSSTVLLDQLWVR